MSLEVRLIGDEVHAPLGRAGFVRRKSVWNRRSAQLVDVVDLQVSKSRDSITLNCGVFDPVAYAWTWRDDAPTFVQEVDCTARARIGELTKGGDWWSLADAAVTASELAALVKTTVIPFLDRLHDPVFMDECLATSVQRHFYPDPLTQIYRAVRLYEQGNLKDAQQLLQGVRTRENGWTLRAREIEAEISSRAGNAR